MKAFEATAIVDPTGEVRVAGVPFSAGTEVEVVVSPKRQSGEQRLPPGEGIRRSAGAWADDPTGLDEYLRQLRQDREQDRRPIEP